MKRFLALTVLGLSLAGCSGMVATDALGIFREEEVNMTQRNYAAADYLIQQARTFIERDDLIKATTLLDKDEARVYSSLGRSIPEQVGVRLSQLGYRMDLTEVSTNSDVNYLKPSARKNEAPDFVLAGTYMRRSQELDINLRITETSTGRVVAVFDYIMPMNREISDLSEPETRIIRLDE